MQSVGLFKRFLVMIYDGLLLFSLVFLSSALLMALYKFVIAPDALFELASTQASNRSLTDLGKLIGLIIVIINAITLGLFYYGWFWTHGGQTPGMKAWNLYLIKPNGKFVDWPLAIKRGLFAMVSWGAIGLGFTWILLNRENLAWHDILTDTKIIRHKPKSK
ncbi:RDD family protein [Arenicella xantha]|uniref:RDD family protein n=1 Tax=Arenicella xantha TaxID=644221 RepID=A0A395JH42_9GAMM|nr:RDD family protein [Arenicella xantha]RBP49236.1 RDD family protein [Arenicella xantha]